MLTREQIMAADDLAGTTVEVPEWGGSVRVRVLSVAEGIAFALARKSTPPEQVVPLLLAFTLADCTPEDLDALCGKNPAVLSRLFDVAVDLNGMGVEQEKARGEDGPPADAQALRDGAPAGRDDGRGAGGPDELR